MLTHQESKQTLENITFYSETSGIAIQYERPVYLEGDGGWVDQFVLTKPKISLIGELCEMLEVTKGMRTY